jgi:hypothetical protein
MARFPAPARPRQWLGVALLAVGVVGLPWLWGAWDRAASVQLADHARARIYVGMPLGEAAAMLDDSWHHFDCQVTARSSLYFYFYGSHDLERTGIVLLGATGAVDRRTVVLVQSFENRLLYQFDGCTPLDLSVTRHG